VARIYHSHTVNAVFNESGDGQMALLRHGTVNFTKNDTESSHFTDEVMTLAHGQKPNSVPVHLCQRPFLLHNLALRNLIENAATLIPQPLTVLIDEKTHAKHPELMLSIQSYCLEHGDIINLVVVDVAEASTNYQELESEVLLLVGDSALLENCDEQIHEGKSLVYVPDTLPDQLGIHELLSRETKNSIEALVTTELLDVSMAQQTADALLNSLALALAHDASFFHWIEGNVGQLVGGETSAIYNLIHRHNELAAAQTESLIDNKSDVIESIIAASSGELDQTGATSLVIAIAAHASVLNESLPAGADGRIWHLLYTLGHHGYFKEFEQKSTAIVDAITNDNPIHLLDDIGSVHANDKLSREQAESAMQWVKEQHKLHLQ